MPSIRFKVEIAPDQLKRMASVLDSKEMKSAVYQSIKRTADAVRQVVIDNLQEHSVMSSKYARRGVTTIAPPSPDVPEGFVVVSSKAIPLIGFDAHGSKRAGVTVDAGENKSPIALHHAFIATVKNKTRTGDIVEHEGIFLRDRVGSARPPAPDDGMGIGAKIAQRNGSRKSVAPSSHPSAIGNARDRAKKMIGGDRRDARHKQNSRPTTARQGGVAAGFAERLPLEQAFGPTAAEIVRADEVQRAIEPVINQILMKNIDSQIDRFIKEKSK